MAGLFHSIVLSLLKRQTMLALMELLEMQQMVEKLLKAEKRAVTQMERLAKVMARLHLKMYKMARKVTKMMQVALAEDSVHQLHQW